MIWRESKSRQLPGIEPRSSAGLKAFSWLEGPQLAWRSSVGLKVLSWLEGPQLAWRSSTCLKVLNLLEGPQLASVSSALQPSCNHQPSQFPIYTTQIHYVGCASASSTVHAVRCRNLHKGRCSTLLISLESSIMLCWISGTRIKFCIPFITSVLFSIAPAIFMVAMTEREQFHWFTGN